MLLELAVENYAVVDRLRVRFHPGLNLLTGETGSGKSIVVDALGLLLGGRASTDVIRTGESKARVSGLFDIGERELAGYETEDGELLIEREILANGKSRVYVGGRPATVAVLRELAPYLGDIHGQHDQQLLFSPEAQLDIVDGFAGTAAQRRAVQAAYAKWRAAQGELQALERSEQEKLRLLDLWTFQAKEIEGESPDPGEDVSLEEERRVQMNAGKLLENAGAAFEMLYEAEDAAYTVLRAVLRKLEDATFTEVRQTLEPAAIAVQEASHLLRGYLGKLEANPARLEEVENRLAALGKLKRKYGGTVEEVLAFLETVRGNIAEAEGAGERMKQLLSDRGKLAGEYETAAAGLSAARVQAAAELARRVEKELASLAMERTVFQVAREAAPWSETGVDRVEFLVSPNRGEEPKPMDRIASGGELSRIALALKTCVIGAGRGPLRTLVFDEVDAGIGGVAADGVARRLKRLAAVNQVLCVTHLAQIASFADHHYRVEKVEVEGRTVARIEELSSDARRQEIGRMLSGARLTPEALRNADQMIRTSQLG
ncbi:MAG: DNA repair protein RecN [Acidobacteriota bacterium]|nr:DNA repair protein RecN [Acidobacteriota bacterium]